MLYKACRTYLIDKLKAAGLKSQPYTSMKKLEKSLESHVGAVLFEDETVSRNASKTYYSDEQGGRNKRRKVFDRTLTFHVILGDYSDERVGKMYDTFLNSLDRGIYVDGNFVPIEVRRADWVDKEDSILKAELAVQITLEFQGGAYKDSELGSLAGVATAVEIS